MRGEHHTNGYTHRLSISQLNEWSDLGRVYKEELTKLFGATLVDLRRSKSPAKVVSRTIKKLEILSLKYPICRSLIEKSNRRLSIKIFYPSRSELGLAFCSFQAEIAARSGQFTTDDASPIQMTVHALQRLMERLNPHRENLILDEIYSCMDFCVNWNQAAQTVGAQTWPLISKNGFFITTASEDSGPAILITYLANVNLSAKWQSVIDALQNSERTRPALLNDIHYIEGFIRSFPWLEKEHAPDVLSILVDENRNIQTTDKIAEIKGDATYNELDSDNTPNSGSSPKASIKPSRNYKSGLNYKTDKPPFKVQTQLKGLVIKKGLSAELIIYLNNGWIGKITNYSRNLEKKIGLFQEFQPGDDVDVTVSRLLYFEDESAWLIHLDRTELVETRWATVKSRYQIGLEYIGNILEGSNGKIIISFEKDVVGRLPMTQMLWLSAERLRMEATEPRGSLTSFTLLGYDDAQKSLLIEISRFSALYADALRFKHRVGDIKIARFIRRYESSIFLTLDTGSISILDVRNCWDRVVENETSEIQVVILSLCVDTGEVHVGLPPPPNVHKANYFRSLSDEAWNHFVETTSVNDTFDVQITSTLNGAYLCTFDNGLVGKIYFKNLDWFSDLDRNKHSVKLGDFITVRIIKMDLRNKIHLDRKSLISNPLLDGRVQLAIGTKQTGIVATVVDYGYFVELPAGMTALIHKSEVPDGISINKSDVVNVEIIEINFENGRISLKLISDC